MRNSKHYLKRIARQQLLALCMTLDEINTDNRTTKDSAVYNFESQDVYDPNDPCFDNIGRIISDTIITTDDTVDITS